MTYELTIELSSYNLTKVKVNTVEFDTAIPNYYHECITCKILSPTFPVQGISGVIPGTSPSYAKCWPGHAQHENSFVDDLVTNIFP